VISVMLIRYLPGCIFRVDVTVVGHAAVFVQNTLLIFTRRVRLESFVTSCQTLLETFSFLMFFVRRCEVGSLFSHLYMLKPSVHLSMVDVL
jgi:hypothetical protein